MIFGPAHDYKVGDDAWIYVSHHRGEMTKGKVVALLDLPDYSYRHYVIEVPTSVDPLLEVRCSVTMRPSDPRLVEMARMISTKFEVEKEAADFFARELLEVADGNRVDG